MKVAFALSDLHLGQLWSSDSQYVWGHGFYWPSKGRAEYNEMARDFKIMLLLL